MTADAPFYADVADAPDGAEARWLTASDGIGLRAVAWRGGRRGTAMIFPGRTEFAEKYGRVAARLVARGFSVVAIDWRGQGLSDRPPSTPMLGHVETFSDYQRDVEALLGFEALLGLPRPRYLVAHSMGGCIGLRTLIERTDFAAAVFSAPMWQLEMRPATRAVAARLARLGRRLGLGARPCRARGPRLPVQPGLGTMCSLRTQKPTPGACARSQSTPNSLSVDRASSGPARLWRRWRGSKPPLRCPDCRRWSCSGATRR